MRSIAELGMRSSQVWMISIAELGMRSDQVWMRSIADLWMPIATVLDLIPASSDTVESEGRKMKQFE